VRAEQSVDPGAGIELCRGLGEHVERGEPLAFLCARSRRLVDVVAERAHAAFSLGTRPPLAPRLVLERVTG
jgi:thymidine phosphorylase